MFNLFNKKDPKCPIDDKTRIWMEDALIWLINQFGEEKILSTQTLTPTKDFFPTHFDGTDTVAIGILPIVAQQMDVNPNNIKIEFYIEGPSPSQQLNDFSPLLQQFEEDQYSAGQYLGKNNNGEFLIAIERGQLSEPDKLIATMAHEIAHIKILGEGRLQDNDEYLTDLTTVFFGLGIFTANSSGQFNTNLSGWRYSRQGYLSQQEWGYALALYAYIRNEETPLWKAFLTKNIQSDFDKSMKFILANKDKVLV